MSPLTPQQIADRTGRGGFIGASEIAAALGVSRWDSPIDIWLKKTGRSEPEPDNPRAAIGHRAEGTMIRWYAEDTGTSMDLVSRNSKSVRHGEFEHAGCTPDAYILDASGKQLGLAQVKCVGAYMAQFWRDDCVPSDVECQCQFELEITRLDWCDVVAWLGGTDFRIERIDRDAEFGEMLIGGAKTFWRYIEKDQPPPIDGAEAWRKYLTARYPRQEETAELLRAPPEVSLWAHRSLDCRESIKEQELEQMEADHNLMNLIGDGLGFYGDDFKVTWKENKAGSRVLRLRRREQTQ